MRLAPDINIRTIKTWHIGILIMKETMPNMTENSSSMCYMLLQDFIARREDNSSLVKETYDKKYSSVTHRKEKSIMVSITNKPWHFSNFILHGDALCFILCLRIGWRRSCGSDGREKNTDVNVHLRALVYF
ncbi:hypothetical protein ACJX0J_015379, partial [Zea mays]